LEDSLKKFEQFMVLEGRSAYTIRQYLHAAKKFLKFLGSRKLDEDVMTEYLAHLHDTENLSWRSVAAHLQAVRKFNAVILRVKLQYELIPRPRRSESFNPTVLTKSQVYEIIEAPKEAQHKVMLNLGYEALLRVGELCFMKTSMVNFKEKNVRVIAEKKGSTVEVPLSTELTTRIANYLKESHPKEYLFEGIRHNPYPPSHFSARIFTPLVKSLDIDCRYHDFARHSRITHLIQDGIDLVTVSKLARHRSISTTMLYITLVGQDLRKKLEEAGILE